jgi:hypothetical protein
MCGHVESDEDLDFSCEDEACPVMAAREVYAKQFAWMANVPRYTREEVQDLHADLELMQAEMHGRDVHGNRR